MGGVPVATILLQIIQYKRHKCKIQPSEITRRQAFVDAYYEELNDLYNNSVIHKMQTPPKTNCPNCGAPLENGKCSYCGTKVSHTVSMDELTPYLNEGNKIHKVL